MTENNYKDSSMIKNNLHRKINFPVPLFQPNEYDEWVSRSNQKLQSMVLQEHPPLSELPSNFVNWFESYYPNIYIKAWQVFHTPPGQETVIHSDGWQPFIDFVKLNWIFDEDSSTMNWYTTDKILSKTYNKYNTPHTLCEAKDVTKVFSSPVGQPGLVNVGVIHNIDNTKNTKWRRCVCLIPNWRTPAPNRAVSSPRILFEEAEIAFKEFIC